MMRFALVSLVLSFQISACSEQMCGNEILAEVPSPDEAYVATLFERNCGATAPFVRAVVIREKGDDFDGNDVERFIFTMRGRDNIGISWVGIDHLEIARPERGNDIFKSEPSWLGIRISYSSE